MKLLLSLQLGVNHAEQQESTQQQKEDRKPPLASTSSQSAQPSLLKSITTQ
jgi:hypothetical protein